MSLKIAPFGGLLGAALAASLGAVAAPPARAAPPPTVENAPAEIIVPAPRDPKVVRTFPSEGATVPGGTLVLKITFDQPMTADAWSYAPVAGLAFPQCLSRPRLLADRRTFVLLCTAELDARFALEVNAAPDFVSSAGRRAAPFRLTFTTSDEMTVALERALQQAGLGASDDPIMNQDPAKGGLEARHAPAGPAP